MATTRRWARRIAARLGGGTVAGRLRALRARGPSARRSVRLRVAPVLRALALLEAVLSRLTGRLTVRRREQRLRRALAALPTAPSDPRKVSVIIPTRDGADRLARLLPTLRACDHEHLEIIVVDNGSGERTAGFLRSQDGIEVLRSETNLSFSAANNRAVEVATGEVLCLLNDDVEPLDGAWLSRLLAALHGDVIAVGAQLIFPRRPLLTRTRTRDLGVQHRGIVFDPVPAGVPRARNAGDGADPDVAGPPFEVVAATAACLVVDRGAFESVGGFDEGYVYGAEDVDLCWRLRRAGGRLMVAPGAVLTHPEGSTRRHERSAVLRERQERNWDRLAARFGPEIARAVALDRLRGGRLLSDEPYRLAITVTRDDEAAGYGDYYTAHELGDALGDLGLDITYVERLGDSWYDLPPDVDGIVVLLDAFDVRRVARPGLVTIAWVRNWTPRWVGSPWFDHFDVVLAASQRSAAIIRERSPHRPVVFPLATNPGRFSPDGRRDRDRVVFTGNHWGADDRASDLVRAVPGLEIHGKGWEAVPEVAAMWKGHRSYDELPRLYRDSLIVVDRAGIHTRDEASVNSRVFDALASGALPVTDQGEGAEEIFGEKLPTYTTPDDLAGLVEELRTRPEAVVALAEELREIVLRDHTYMRRARDLRDLLVERVEPPRLVLKMPPPDARLPIPQQDRDLAIALAGELRGRRYDVRLLAPDRWADRDGCAYDVAVVLHSRYAVPRTPGQFHVIWTSADASRLGVAERDDADLVLVASRSAADELQTRTTTPVRAFLPATDERRFRPVDTVASHRHDLAFVGDAGPRGRRVVADALEAGLRPAVYGAGWEGAIEPGLVVADRVPHEHLAVIYSSVSVLLVDHPDELSQHGLVPGQVLDALACAACVVAYDDEELTALLGDGVRTYRSPPELAGTVEELLEDGERRRAVGERGRRRILSAHTIGHRADELLALLEGHHARV